MQNDDGITTVNLQYFDKVETINKNGRTVKHLITVSTNVSLSFIIDFISQWLSKIIHPGLYLGQNCLCKAGGRPKQEAPK